MISMVDGDQPQRANGLTCRNRSAGSSSLPAANSVSGWAIKSVTRSSMLLGSSTNVGSAICTSETGERGDGRAMSTCGRSSYADMDGAEGVPL